MAAEENTLTVEQLKVLSNPRRLEILTSLRAYGPATVGELAERLATEEHLLFYHVKLMARHELVVPLGTRPGTTKPVTIYRARYPGSAEGLDYTDPLVRRAVCRNVTAILRAATKEFETAATVQPTEVDSKTAVMRVTTKMSSTTREELRVRLRGVTAWLAEQRDEDGEPYSLTIMMTPLS